MPIDYRIDHERRLVAAEGHGAISAQDLFAYQLEVWSRPDVAGFSELMDMTDVQQVVEPSGEGMHTLAELSARMDPSTGGGRFAIVAPLDLAFGLGRMYQTYRELSGSGTKQVGVFRSLAEALRWLAEPTSAQ
jgi:hypothetical protein